LATEIITIMHKPHKVRHAGLFTKLATTIPSTQVVWRDWPGYATKSWVVVWSRDLHAQKPAWNAALLPDKTDTLSGFILRLQPAGCTLSLTYSI